MIKVPTLQRTDFNYENVFLDKVESNEEKSFFDLVSKSYPNIILDIYDHCLDLNSNELNNLDSEYFRLANEEKYLNFIDDVFDINEQKCYVKIYFNISDNDFFLESLNRLDIIDKHIMLHQLKVLNSCSDDNFLISDINLLKMFMRGILREFLHVDLFFPKKSLLLFFNYDLSLPLVFKYKDDLNDYMKVAKRNDLYFR